MSEPELIPLLDGRAIDRALRRMAAQIIEHHLDASCMAIIGVPTRGVALAKRLVQLIGSEYGQTPQFGVVDVAMHRDDYFHRAPASPVTVSHLPLPLEGRQLVLVDDVLFTGRTTRAALDAISSYGRPDRVQLAVLVDRGHRELPIQPDYVGTQITTDPSERIRVRLKDVDDLTEDAVWLVRPQEEPQ